MPSWNTALGEESTNCKAMNNAAESVVDRRMSRLNMFPDAVDEIWRELTGPEVWRHGWRQLFLVHVQATVTSPLERFIY